MTHSARLHQHEQSAYDNWADMEAKSKNPKAQNFQILARKYCLDPHYATTGWFNPTLPPSRKMRQIIKTCNEWDQSNIVVEKQDPDNDEKPVVKRKPEVEQKKLVIHTL